MNMQSLKLISAVLLLAVSAFLMSEVFDFSSFSMPQTFSYIVDDFNEHF